ncbi:MAG: uracil-DNA glycosylase family protein [Comamonadaceae bacterium]|nr:uracil-DNA glycosylase family protein [Comamonadaceae bacterium]
MPEESLAHLLTRVRACRLCAAQLPLGPRPVLQAAGSARILLAGQAPGRKVHASGIPFDDASGARLRAWLGLNAAQFYDPALVAILPMGFCYPGTGKSGDLPPRPECAPAWRAPLLAQLAQIELTVVLGQYALAWHLPQARGGVTAAVRDWRRHWPHTIALPHPSPRNNGWLQRNPWFEAELLPQLRARVLEIVQQGAQCPPQEPQQPPLP